MKKFIALFLSLILAVGAGLTVTAQDAYTATFSITGGDGTITVYDTQDYTSGYTSDTAVARDSDTGEIDVSGSGQINFTVVLADGYEVASVTVTGGYKNLKGPSDTGVDDTYRITKVTGDLTVSVVLEESDGSEADTGDPVVTFTDSGASVTSGRESGVSISGTAVKITSAGAYTFTGSCSNGSIVVKKGVTGVTLILDGLTLTASATAPITCNKGSGVTIVAAAGTVNTLTDDQYNNDDYYTDETTYPDIENAVIKCKDGSNVTICGTGTINVNAYGKNGVKGGADLYEEDDDGNYTDVLLSTASLTIEDVTLNVSIKHSYKDPDDSTSYDGDGIKSEKELNILSGNITVSANDDGVKCDYTLNIGAEGTDGPTINVTKSTEGIEGAVVNVYSGNIYVTASDDGINAANGDIAERSADFSYNQYGGYVYVNVTNGDGIDSNGSVNLAGGTLEVYAPSQGDGDPIDTEYGCTFSGCTVLAVGNNAMQQSYSGTYVAFGGSGMGGFGGSSGMGGMFGGMSGGSDIVTAGSTIAIKDQSGNTVYTANSASPRSASYVLFSSPALTANGSYTLYNGSTSSAVSTASTASSGNPGGMGGNPGGNPFGDQTDVSQPDGTLPDDMGQSGTRPGGMVPGGTRPGSDRSGADPFGDLPENTTAAEPASTTDQTAMPTAPAAPSEIAEPTTEAEITTATETPATDPRTAASDETATTEEAAATPTGTTAAEPTSTAAATEDETTTDASAAEFIPGDVNGDGVVDAIDARLVLRAAAKLDTLSGTQLLAADVNGDGIVDATDARAILRAAAKLEELTST